MILNDLFFSLILINIPNINKLDSNCVSVLFHMWPSCPVVTICLHCLAPCTCLQAPSEFERSEDFIDCMSLVTDSMTVLDELCRCVAQTGPAGKRIFNGHFCILILHIKLLQRRDAHYP